MTGSAGPGLSHWEGEPLHVWRDLWRVPDVEAWTSVGSTNARAREWAATGGAPWSLVVAEEQTAGRGREGRPWRSESGRGLWFSLIARDEGPATGLLALRVGLGVATVVRSLGGGASVGLKWPNDLWWQDRKLGGILCTRDSVATVIGVGLNLRSPEAGDYTVTPAGLDEVVEGRVARGPLLGALVASIRSCVEAGGARLSPVELERLRGCDCLRDRAVRCEPGPGGIARGVGPDGGLRIETGKGIRTVHAGTVRPIGPTSRSAARDAGEEAS